MQIRHEEETFGDYSIKLGGLPFRTPEREIIDWFSPKAKCARVKILKDNNRPNGRAIAEFVSKNDAEAAMELNHDYLGDRYIILTPVDF